MQVIYCLINEFELKQHICLMDKETGSKEFLESVEMDDIGHRVSTYSKERDVHEIVLMGNSAEFLDRFVDDIYTVNALMYNITNPIHISIMTDEEGE